MSVPGAKSEVDPRLCPLLSPQQRTSPGRPGAPLAGMKPIGRARAKSMVGADWPQVRSRQSIKNLH